MTKLSDILWGNTPTIEIPAELEPTAININCMEICCATVSSIIDYPISASGALGGCK